MPIKANRETGQFDFVCNRCNCVLQDEDDIYIFGLHVFCVDCVKVPKNAAVLRPRFIIILVAEEITA